MPARSPASPEEHFVSLLSKHEPAVRAYIRAAIPKPEEAAEVMQTASIVAWKKFSQLNEPDKHFAGWMCVIARYEILMFRRSQARDRLVLAPDLIETITEEGIEETHEREHWIRTLKSCIDSLPNDRQRLIREAYSEGASIKTIAEKRGKKANALYQLLSRIRAQLALCVDRELSTSS